MDTLQILWTLAPQVSSSQMPLTRALPPHGYSPAGRHPGRGSCPSARRQPGPPWLTPQVCVRYRLPLHLRKEIKDTNGWKDTCVHRSEGLQLLKCLCYPRAIYRFNTIPFKITMAFFTERKKKTLTVYGIKE